MAQTKTKTVGRRKTSIASAELLKGSGKVTVNKVAMEEYFKGSVKQQQDVISPLKVTNNEKAFDVVATVKGGGLSSQAGAVRHAIARSLSAMSEDNKKLVKKAGYLTRDPRMVERKKPGQPGARKKYQFSKR
ncbi:small subunit ribosomal protein S9 [Elusimicrobium posterum]|uniref:30S ribosomal protein S9 n=1 Tax=Elusimicrobium posterum TaxID=3116653 RepID=UPI003C707A48